MAVLLVICSMVWCIPVFFQEDGFPEETIRFTPVKLEAEEQHLISPSQWKAKQFSGSAYRYRDSQPRSFSKQRLQVEINSADSVLWEMLPGIGERLSSRIVRYRERLGGFVAVDQLREVYGINDTLFRQISEHISLRKGSEIRRLALNSADYKGLRQHPYMSHVMAKVLLAYRQTHGRIDDSLQLKQINGLDEKALGKLMPYLAFD